MTARRVLGRKDESGAALILVIAFLILMAAIGAAVTAAVTSGVGDRAVLDQVRNREYDADAAIETWIVQIRNTSSGACPAAATTFASLNDPSNSSKRIRVECTAAGAVVVGPGGQLLSQNNLIFTACLKTGAGANGVLCTQSIGQPSTAIINAQVNFQGGAAPLTTYVQSWSVNR